MMALFVNIATGRGLFLCWVEFSFGLGDERVGFFSQKRKKKPAEFSCSLKQSGKSYKRQFKRVVRIRNFEGIS